MHTATTTPRSNNRWQPHRTIIRVAEGDEPDFTDLGIFSCGDVTLTPRQHQVVAMFAFGFLSDRIVADYLHIKAKYVQNIVAELKKEYGWQTRRDMARAYEAMREKAKPQGVKPMKPAITAEKPMSTNGHTAATLEDPPPPALPRKPIAPGEFDPASVYPAQAVEAAWEEMEKEPMGRRVKNVFTPEVVAVWLDWIDQGKSLLWIAENNGLVPTSYMTARSYVVRYRSEAEQLRSGEGWVAAPLPKEVERPKPQQEAIGTEQLVKALTAVLGAASFSGKVERTERGLKIDLEIEFGK